MSDAKILRKLSPQEWRERDRRSLATIMATGTSQPSEKEFFRRDGSRVPVLVGGAAFGGRGREGVAFVVDLTERKRVEALARENEQRYRLELEHANRVAMMGQLSASIAHEVNQPTAAIFTSAETGLRWLGAQPPDLDRAQQGLHHIVDSSRRASEIIGGIRQSTIRRTREAFSLCSLDRSVRTGREQDILGQADRLALREA